MAKPLSPFKSIRDYPQIIRPRWLPCFDADLKYINQVYSQLMDGFSNDKDFVIEEHLELFMPNYNLEYNTELNAAPPCYLIGQSEKWFSTLFLLLTIIFSHSGHKVPNLSTNNLIDNFLLCVPTDSSYSPISFRYDVPLISPHYSQLLSTILQHDDPMYISMFLLHDICPNDFNPSQNSMMTEPFSLPEDNPVKQHNKEQIIERLINRVQYLHSLFMADFDSITTPTHLYRKQFTRTIIHDNTTLLSSLNHFKQIPPSLVLNLLKRYDITPTLGNIDALTGSIKIFFKFNFPSKLVKYILNRTKFKIDCITALPAAKFVDITYPIVNRYPLSIHDIILLQLPLSASSTLEINNFLTSLKKIQYQQLPLFLHNLAQLLGDILGILRTKPPNSIETTTKSQKSTIHSNSNMHQLTHFTSMTALHTIYIFMNIFHIETLNLFTQNVFDPFINILPLVTVFQSILFGFEDADETNPSYQQIFSNYSHNIVKKNPKFLADMLFFLFVLQRFYIKTIFPSAESTETSSTVYVRNFTLEKHFFHNIITKFADHSRSKSKLHSISQFNESTGLHSHHSHRKKKSKKREKHPDGSKSSAGANTGTSSIIEINPFSDSVSFSPNSNMSVEHEKDEETTKRNPKHSEGKSQNKQKTKQHNLTPIPNTYICPNTSFWESPHVSVFYAFLIVYPKAPKKVAQMLADYHLFLITTLYFIPIDSSRESSLFARLIGSILAVDTESFALILKPFVHPEILHEILDLYNPDIPKFVAEALIFKISFEIGFQNDFNIYDLFHGSLSIEFFKVKQPKDYRNPIYFSIIPTPRSLTATTRKHFQCFLSFSSPNQTLDYQICLKPYFKWFSSSIYRIFWETLGRCGYDDVYIKSIAVLPTILKEFTSLARTAYFLTQDQDQYQLTVPTVNLDTQKGNINSSSSHVLTAPSSSLTAPYLSDTESIESDNSSLFYLDITQNFYKFQKITPKQSFFPKVISNIPPGELEPERIAKKHHRDLAVQLAQNATKVKATETETETGLGIGIGGKAKPKSSLAIPGEPMNDSSFEFTESLMALLYPSSVQTQHISSNTHTATISDTFFNLFLSNSPNLQNIIVQPRQKYRPRSRDFDDFDLGNHHNNNNNNLQNSLILQILSVSFGSTNNFQSPLVAFLTDRVNATDQNFVYQIETLFGNYHYSTPDYITKFFALTLPLFPWKSSNITQNVVLEWFKFLFSTITLFEKLRNHFHCSNPLFRTITILLNALDYSRKSLQDPDAFLNQITSLSRTMILLFLMVQIQTHEVSTNGNQRGKTKSSILHLPFVKDTSNTNYPLIVALPEYLFFESSEIEYFARILEFYFLQSFLMHTPLKLDKVIKSLFTLASSIFNRNTPTEKEKGTKVSFSESQSNLPFITAVPDGFDQLKSDVFSAFNSLRLTRNQFKTLLNNYTFPPSECAYLFFLHYIKRLPYLDNFDNFIAPVPVNFQDLDWVYIPLKNNPNMNQKSGSTSSSILWVPFSALKLAPHINSLPQSFLVDGFTQIYVENPLSTDHMNRKQQFLHSLMYPTDVQKHINFPTEPRNAHSQITHLAHPSHKPRKFTFQQIKYLLFSLFEPLSSEMIANRGYSTSNHIEFLQSSLMEMYHCTLQPDIVDLPASFVFDEVLYFPILSLDLINNLTLDNLNRVSSPGKSLQYGCFHYSQYKRVGLDSKTILALELAQYPSTIPVVKNTIHRVSTLSHLYQFDISIKLYEHIYYCSPVHVDKIRRILIPKGSKFRSLAFFWYSLFSMLPSTTMNVPTIRPSTFNMYFSIFHDNVPIYFSKLLKELKELKATLKVKSIEKRPEPRQTFLHNHRQIENVEAHKRSLEPFELSSSDEDIEIPRQNPTKTKHTTNGKPKVIEYVDISDSDSDFDSDIEEEED